MAITPFSTWIPAVNFGGPMSAHLGLILHVQEGNNSPIGWFNNPAAPVASSTWWVSKTGAVQQFVDTSNAAYAQGAGNATYNSVESEGFATEPLTVAQIDALATIYAWGMANYGWPLALANAPGQGGLGTHGMGGAAWGNHPGCPGTIRANQRQDILNAITAPTPPVQFQEDTVTAVELSNGQIKIYAVGAGNADQHLLEFTRTPGSQSNDVRDISLQVGNQNNGGLFLVQG